MISQSNLTSNIFWKLCERILTQFVTFFISVVLARLLNPEDYGTVLLVIVFVNVSNIFLTDGLPNALIQKKDISEIHYSSVFWVNIVYSSVLYIILYFCAPHISNYYNDSQLTPIIRITSLTIISSAYNSVQNAFIARNMLFKKCFYASFAASLISCLVGLCMAYASYGAWALVAQYVLGMVLNTFFLCFIIKWFPKMVFSFSDLKSLIRYGWKILVEGISYSCYNETQNLIVAKVYSASDLGCFSKGKQLPGVLVANICTVVSSVLFPVMSSFQDDKEKVKDILRQYERTVCYMLFPVLFGVAAAGDRIIEVLLTKKWMGCVPYLRIACLYYLFYVWIVPQNQALNAKGRSDVYLIENFIARLIGMGVLIIFYRHNVVAVAVCGLCGIIVTAIINVFTGKKYNNYYYAEQLMDVLPTLLLCCGMYLVVSFCGKIINDEYLSLLCQVGTGVFLYIGLSYLFKIESFIWIMGYAKKRIGR